MGQKVAVLPPAGHSSTLAEQLELQTTPGTVYSLSALHAQQLVMCQKESILAHHPFLRALGWESKAKSQDASFPREELS